MIRRRSGVPILAAIALLTGFAVRVLGACGPFTDVSDPAFCPFVEEILVLGITTGTSPSTYSPDEPVTRLQMAAFLSRTVDQTLKRGSGRAALGRFWTPRGEAALGVTTVFGNPERVGCDGSDVWVASLDGTVARVRASDGRLLGRWMGADRATAILPAMGKIFVGGNTNPGVLYRIDPARDDDSAPPLAEPVATIPVNVVAMTFDGHRIWTTFNGGVSIVTPGAALPWTSTNVTIGYFMSGALFDGENVWITDGNAGTLIRLDANGSRLQTVTVGLAPSLPAFDGTNIWVPNITSGTLSVVRAETGAVLATLTGNGLEGATAAAFDGERVLVVSRNKNVASLWKASDLAPLGWVQLVNKPFPNPNGVCSDGLNFWISMFNLGTLVRY